MSLKSTRGNGTRIMKGGTIGGGAAIGANSVVVSDIPPYCLATEARRVRMAAIGRPSRKAQAAAAASGPAGRG